MSSERLCYFPLFNLCSNSVQKPYTKKHSDDFFAFSFQFVFLPISTLPVEVSSFRELSSLCQYLSVLSSHPQDTLFSSDFVLFCLAKFLFLWSWKCTQGLWMVLCKVPLSRSDTKSPSLCTICQVHAWRHHYRGFPSSCNHVHDLCYSQSRMHKHYNLPCSSPGKAIATTRKGSEKKWEEKWL